MPGEGKPLSSSPLGKPLSHVINPPKRPIFSQNSLKSLTVSNSLDFRIIGGRIIALERKIHEMEENIDKLMDQNTQLKMALLKAQMQPPRPTAIVIRTTPLPPMKL